MEVPFLSSTREPEAIRRGIDDRYYIPIVDPRTGEISEARIEPSLESDDYINLSFEPYLYCQPALLPERSRQARFARRPAYGFLKTDIGLQDCHVRDPDIMGQEDLEAKARDLGTPDIIMAPWAYPDPAKVTLKVQWRDGSKSITTRSAWNTVIEGGQKRIDSFWKAVGQLKPPLLAEQGGNGEQQYQEPVTDLQTHTPDVHAGQTEPQIYKLARHYPILTSLLSQLSASDTAIFLALIPGLLSLDLQTKYLDPTRDLPDSSWWKEKISQGFEIYLVGLQAGLLWERIYQPLKYWAEDRPQVLRVWVAAIAPDAERRRRGDGAAGVILNSQEEYVIHKNWELDWYTTAEVRRRRVNSRPYFSCGNSSCAGCPFVSPLLPPPFVFEATNCEPCQMGWFCTQGGSGIELAWSVRAISYSCPPKMIVCENSECHDCPSTVFDIGGICTNTTSVPYICLSTKQLANSSLYETYTEGSIGDPRFEIVVSIELRCLEQRVKRRLMHIKRLRG